MNAGRTGLLLNTMLGRGGSLTENFPFDNPAELLAYIDAKRGMRVSKNVSTQIEQVAIAAPKTPNITSEDILSLAQAVVLVLASFLPGVSDKQQMALIGLAAVLGTILSHSGTKRRVARNERYSQENSVIIDAGMQRDVARIHAASEETE
jgi:hypothetical protein